MPATTETSTDISEARRRLRAHIEELDARIASVAELEAERDRLTEALKLMGDGPSEKPARARRAQPAARKKSTGRRSDNKDKALAYLRSHPGAEAGAIVEHLGVSRGVTYNLLGRLVSQGAVLRETAEGTRNRYRVVE